ncbi:tetratricopeptide repeat protein, partial [Candidatus Fermentibacterales bacterium]|nr:tetratricopeptide repeat protein [Candidatus Fermentibacterales bacterium]
DARGSVAFLVSILPDWRPVYMDRLTVAYARDDVVSECGLQQEAFQLYDPLEPETLLEKPLYLIPGAALEELERAAGTDQAADVPTMLLCVLYSRLGRYEEALAAAGTIGTAPVREQLRSALEGSPEGVGPGLPRSLLAQHQARSGDLSGLSQTLSGLPAGEFAWALAAWCEHVADPHGTPVFAGPPPWVPPWAVGLRTEPVPEEERLMMLASAAWASGEAGAGDSLARLALRGDSTSVTWVWCCGAMISLVSGEMAEAERRAGQALENGRTPFALVTMARVARAAGRYHESVSLFREALELAPSSDEVRLGLIESMWDAGMLTEIRRQFPLQPDAGAACPPSLARRLAWLRLIAGELPVRATSGSPTSRP